MTDMDTRVAREDTKYGSDLNDHDWDPDPDEPEDDGRPPVEVTSHVIRVDDNRYETGYEHGIEWMFNVEGGTIVGWYRGHYLEGRTQSDPMHSPAWDDIPAPVRGAVRTELNPDQGSVKVDAPDFYGEDQR